MTAPGSERAACSQRLISERGRSYLLSQMGVSANKCKSEEAVKVGRKSDQS